MRIREIEQIVSDNLDIIKTQIAFLDGSSRNYLQNYKGVMSAIERLSEFEFLKEEVKSLREFDYIYYNRSDDDTIYIDQSSLNVVLNNINSIISKCTTVIKLVSEALPSERTEESIDVKLPDYTDLPKISNFFEDLNKALEILVVNDDIKGKVQLQSFESGSLWLNIVVGTTAVNWIGKVMDAVMNVRHKYYETELLKTQIRSLNTAADVQEQVLAATEASVKEYVKIQTTELLSDGTINADPEYIAKLQYSIQTLARLVYEGAEIHPALGSPREIKEEFPKYLSIDPKEIKKIKETSENINELSKQTESENEVLDN